MNITKKLLIGLISFSLLDGAAVSPLSLLAESNLPCSEVTPAIISMMERNIAMIMAF